MAPKRHLLAAPSLSGYQGGRKVRTADCRKCLVFGSLHHAGVSTPKIDAICARLWLNRVRRRQILYTEGNRASQLFAIRAGQVKLVKIDAQGREHVVALLQSGDLFGLEAVFGTAYSTGAEALTDCELCSGGGTDLAALMSETSGLATDLARYLHERLLHAWAHSACSGSTRAAAKVASYLLLEASRAEEEHPTIQHDLTHAELGAVLGIAPETVCRVLSAFKARGIVDVGRGALRITDVDAMRQEAAS